MRSTLDLVAAGDALTSVVLPARATLVAIAAADAVIARLTRSALASAIVVVAFCHPVQAKSRWIEGCYLKVGGKAYLDQACFFSPADDGSFMIGGASEDTDKGRMPFFASVQMSGNGKAQGYWNEDASATHAQTPLGTLVRDDSDPACWRNATSRICAR